MFKLISATFFRQVIAGLSQLATLVIIAKVLTVTEMGQYTVVILIPTLLSQILTLGIQSSNIYAVGRKKLKVEEGLYINLILLSILGIVGTSITILVLTLFSDWLFPEIPKILLILSSFAITPLLFVTSLPSLLQAIQNFILFNVTCILQPLFLLGSVLVSLAFSHNISVIISAYLFSSFSSFFAILYLILKNIKPQQYSLIKFLKDFFGYSLQSHLSNVLTLLNYRSSILIISYLTTPVLVGLYTVGLQLVEKLWLPSQAASTILLPRVTQLLENSESNAVKLTLDTARLVLVLTIAIAIIFILILPMAIDFLFGDRYKDSFLIALILLPGIIAWTPSRVIANDIAARGMANVNLKIAFQVLIVNVFLSIVLVINFEIEGAAIATTIAFISDLFFRLYAYKIITKSPVAHMLIPRKTDISLIISTVKRLT